MSCGRLGFDPLADKADGSAIDGADGQAADGSSGACAFESVALSESMAKSAQGSNLTQEIAASCAPQGTPELAFHVEVETTASFRFDHFSPQGDTLVVVLDGSDCASAELACEEGSATLLLEAGQELIVAVEAPGASGADTIGLTAVALPPL